ncbi:glucokinase [Erythrobacter arachoides]|uniref:Glucokinase n=1 Tax=Aurantiacibacter arachoides TaxID=1850444 RepID=A0A844ZYL4_9SPHN|nr:glucokinase [Aurantiacibacter arachoides]MXO92332.1 glucokinase [Aurantiacibacter arachoides]GGD58027.1 glucokinase [Aurantiacibacter arachoides]
MTPVTRIVAVDIGGTHARFAIATRAPDGAITLDEPITLHTEDHASFQTAWEDYRARKGGVLPDAVAMAIAGPVGGQVIRFTNNPWIIRPALVEEKLGVSSFTIVNDFEAVAHAVARAGCDEFIHLTGPDEPLGKTGRLSVLGPGTGLGVAHLYREPDGTYRVSATEGGHVDFAPLDPIEDAILARLRKRHTRVSVERVVAGPAIVDIYETLAALEGRAVLAQDDVTIWTAGMDGSDSLAAAAIDRFCLSLGAVAGDTALAQGGFAGVVIAGGLGYRLRDHLPRSGFAERFRAKGRFETMMAAIPVKLITHPQPGLFGAAAAYFQQHDRQIQGDAR